MHVNELVVATALRHTESLLQATRWTTLPQRAAGDTTDCSSITDNKTHSNFYLSSMREGALLCLMFLEIGATKSMILFKKPQPLNKYSRLSQKDENAIAALPKRSDADCDGDVDGSGPAGQSYRTRRTRRHRCSGWKT